MCNTKLAISSTITNQSLTYHFKLRRLCITTKVDLISLICQVNVRFAFPKNKILYN